jgi:hypothetical protein
MSVVSQLGSPTLPAGYLLKSSEKRKGWGAPTEANQRAKTAPTLATHINLLILAHTPFKRLSTLTNAILAFALCKRMKVAKAKPVEPQ